MRHTLSVKKRSIVLLHHLLRNCANKAFKIQARILSKLLLSKDKNTYLAGVQKGGFGRDFCQFFAPSEPVRAKTNENDSQKLSIG